MLRVLSWDVVNPLLALDHCGKMGRVYTSCKHTLEGGTKQGHKCSGQSWAMGDKMEVILSVELKRTQVSVGDVDVQNQQRLDSRPQQFTSLFSASMFLHTD